MNRRKLLKTAAVITPLTLTLPLASYIVFIKQNSVAYSDFSSNIQDLAEPIFCSALSSRSSVELVSYLNSRGILVGATVHVSKIKQSSHADNYLEFNNRFYSEPELVLYALVSRLKFELCRIIS
jgi:hypothetical protein